MDPVIYCPAPRDAQQQQPQLSSWRLSWTWKKEKNSRFIRRMYLEVSVSLSLLFNKQMIKEGNIFLFATLNNTFGHEGGSNLYRMSHGLCRS
jgi:hypothetical protein